MKSFEEWTKGVELNTDTTTDAPVCFYAIVSLLGHKRVAGRCTEQELAGQSFLRVDIPMGDRYETKLYGTSSIYSIEPVTEEAVKLVAEQLYSTPIRLYDIPETFREAMRKNQIAAEERYEQRRLEYEDDWR